MTSFADLIQRIVPDADMEFCEYIMWGRTAFPFGRVDARRIYKATSAVIRANANKRKLCDHCDNIAVEGKWTCVSCDRALRSTMESIEI
jgi:hypothetical protein